MTGLGDRPTLAAMKPDDPQTAELDMIGRELYARRLRELTLFGAMTEEQAHRWAMRYAMGKSSAPIPLDAYPDDYAYQPAQ